MNPESPVTPEAQLCAACGMCCNGILFYGTRVDPSDALRALAALGLRGKLKDGVLQFLQPCPAYHDSRCRIYDKRPLRCRTFVCRQLQALAEGSCTQQQAQARVEEAQNHIARVRELFEKLGDTRENKPFARRYAALFTPPLSPSVEATQWRGELQRAMTALEALLTDHFRPAETEP